MSNTDVAPSSAAKVSSTTAGKVALEWWSRLTDKKSGDAGARARLRRSRSTGDAFGERAALALARRLQSVKPKPSPDRALDLARVLVHVREHVSITPMRAVGWKTFPYDRTEAEGGGERPVLSETRFRRLMKAEHDNDELVVAFVRLVRLLDGNCNVARLAEDFLYWGDRSRERMAFEYYAAGSPVSDPSDTSTDTSSEDNE